MEVMGITDSTLFKRIAIHPWAIEGTTVIVAELLIVIGNEVIEDYPNIVVDPLVPPGEFNLQELDLGPILPFDGNKFPHLAKGMGWEKIDGTWRSKPR
jgi:hypothetical protein